MILVLASQSPRRRELLAQLGLSFQTRTAEICEQRQRGESPEALVRRLAAQKAAAVPRGADEVVLGADTVVVLGRRILGKPATAQEAARMLCALSGRRHRVLTGFCLLAEGRRCCGVEETFVDFRALSVREIAAYVRSGEPMDKAGAYGIQGRGGAFVTGIVGDYTTVVGLPLCRLGQLLPRFGVPLWDRA